MKSYCEQPSAGRLSTRPIGKTASCRHLRILIGPLELELAAIANEYIFKPSIGKEAMAGTANTVPKINRLSTMRLSISTFFRSESIFSSLMGAPQLWDSFSLARDGEQVALCPNQVAERHFPRLCFPRHTS